MMKLPDIPKAPHWLQKFQYFTDPIGYLESNRELYGDIFYTPISDDFKRLLLVSHPEALKQLFTGEGKGFEGKPFVQLQFLLGDRSVVCLEGDAHRRERKLLMPCFQEKRIGAYGQIICDLTEQVFSQLTPGTTFSACSVVGEITLDINLNIVFGLNEGKSFQKLKQLITDLFNSFTSPLISSVILFPSLRKDLGAWSPWGYIRRLIDQIDELLYTEIRNLREQDNPGRTDILGLLLSAKDEEGQGMSDRQLRDELLTLIFAGYDSTRNAVCWALYWIHLHPEVREKLLHELDTLDGCPEAMTIFKLPYLTAACNESLRICPVAFINVTREVKEPVELMGYQLEPGTGVYASIYLTHHREDLYPDSRKFKPERFLERQYTPYEFIPFGGGSRRCIGDNLALLEMKLILATVLENYQLALVNNQQVKVQGRNQWVKFDRRASSTSPSGGLKMVLKSKRQT
ncbi:cytochrome P450 [Okeania sp. KiyG1]|uniref:cytochrome P450 n=1 Tax=Okeania sp. KiyG1 TaxID=2720165 RepID=UPI001924B3CC|nr:cytochrome P450 [Okeania sp. KiyG1]GFZ92515.1 cytochrome P450 [Okeania sp. KiyG1]